MPKQPIPPETRNRSFYQEVDRREVAHCACPNLDCMCMEWDLGGDADDHFICVACADGTHTDANGEGFEV